jgi:hypothetical protein
MWLLVIPALLSLSLSVARAAPLDRMEPVPAGWTGKVFNPSYAFPTTLPAQEPRPWSVVDFRADPAGYMAAVLAYVLEGQDRTTWDVAANPVRKWYHGPWMGPGGNGREFINGLTRERNSRPLELGPMQTSCRQNWAVGFYNPVGGFTLGRIWAPVSAGTGKPDMNGLPFLEGTVAAKLLYTEATDVEVPLLAGAPEVQANINVRSNPADPNCPANTEPREPASLRLLQLDVAVRDSRATETGWVFGTFVYDGRLPVTDPWAKIKPVGLMWGNDPTLSDAEAAQGKKPVESIVMSDFGLGRAFGRGGRMNGPVDNPISACLACHMTAQWPNPAPVTPPSGASWGRASCWFRNLGSTTPFGAPPSNTVACGALSSPAPVSLDFSLQLAVGVRNYAREPKPLAGTFSLDELKAARAADNEIFRFDGAESLPINREGTE